jgi:hypothetical protein
MEVGLNKAVVPEGFAAQARAPDLVHLAQTVR